MVYCAIKCISFGFVFWCFMKVWLLRIFGFIVGTALAFAFEFALLLIINEVFDTRLVPRGIGWVAIPFFIGVGAAKLAPELSYFTKFKQTSFKQWFWSRSTVTRIVVIAPIFWICSVALYVFLFEPYGYMRDRDYMHMLKVMLFPTAILVVGHMVYLKLIVPKSAENKHNKAFKSDS
ncbi:TPA: hypothetical protein I7190_26795 [Vibrio vulnificus]|nr:hypothetical protein [Vibrio vulnificus]